MRGEVTDTANTMDNRERDRLHYHYIGIPYYDLPNWTTDVCVTCLHQAVHGSQSTLYHAALTLGRLSSI